MRTSAHGIQFITGFEGFRSCPYQLGDGVTTIGFGTTHGVTMRTPCMTRTAALRRFAKDLAAYEHALNVAIKRYRLKLTGNEYDAFVDFLYNLGTGMLGTDHDFGRALAHRDVKGAIHVMTEYSMPGSPFHEGLLHRREAEQHLARARTKPVLTHDEKLVAGWEARLVRLRADVRKLGHWTAGRRALAKELEADIANHSKGRHK
jgi:GH24 family phage-related lysozyme (muramidase)